MAWLSGEVFYMAGCPHKAAPIPPANAAGKERATHCNGPHVCSGGQGNAGTSLSWEARLLKGEKPAQGFSSSPSLSTRVVWTHQKFGSWGFVVVVVVWFVFLDACQKGALRTLYLSSSSQCLSAWGKRRHSYSLPINLSFSLWLGCFASGIFFFYFFF